MKHALCIDAWNQAGLDEVSMTCRSAATGHERNDADIKMALIRTSGFKAGQSKDGGIGYEAEVSQTINAHMSALEPTMLSVQSNPPMKCFPHGAYPTISANSGEAGQDQAAILKNKNKGNTNMTAEVRRLATGECGKLQGFPKGYLSANGQGDSAQYSEAGNSWAVPNARIVIKGIHRVDEKLCGKKRGFKYGTISSGVEAHTMASVGLGDKAVFYSEISPAPCSVLKHHYPDVPNLGDMTLVDYDPEKKCIHNCPYDGYKPPSEEDLGFKPFATPEPVEIPAEFGDVDLVSGGTPCQSISVAGKRHGMAEESGTRSSLAFQLPRIGAAVGAKFVLWENVPGAFSSNGGRDFAWLIHRMTEYGYKSIAWRTFDAQFCRSDKHPRAVPQRRRRVWIVGYRGDDWRVPCEALFEPMKVLGNEPPIRSVGVGFTEKANSEGKLEVGSDDELLEFNEFMKGVKENIINVLVKKGVCISPEERRKELEDAKSAASSSDDDLFGGDLFGPVEKKHQGRGLKAKDLELNLPKESSIAKVGLANLYLWAKSVCKEVAYCGNLFQDWEWEYKTIDYKTDPEAIKKAYEDGMITVLVDEALEKIPWDKVSEEKKLEMSYTFKTGAKRKTDEKKVETLDEQMLSNIGNAGFLADGIVCTMKMPEWNAGITEEELATMPKELAELYDGDVCGLSDILEDNPDPKYRLSWRACYGILNRAMKRAKKLPIELAYALVERMVDEAAKVKWYAMNGKDVVKKEGQLSERAVAKIAYDDFIEAEAHWVEVQETEPKKGEETPEDDGGDDDDECVNEDGATDEE